MSNHKQTRLRESVFFWTKANDGWTDILQEFWCHECYSNKEVILLSWLSPNVTNLRYKLKIQTQASCASLHDVFTVKPLLTLRNVKMFLLRVGTSPVRWCTWATGRRYARFCASSPSASSWPSSPSTRRFKVSYQSFTAENCLSNSEDVEGVALIVW